MSRSLEAAVVLHETLSISIRRKIDCNLTVLVRRSLPRVAELFFFYRSEGQKLSGEAAEVLVG